MLEKRVEVFQDRRVDDLLVVEVGFKHSRRSRESFEEIAVAGDLSQKGDGLDLGEFGCRVVAGEPDFCRVEFGFELAFDVQKLSQQVSEGSFELTL